MRMEGLLSMHMKVIALVMNGGLFLDFSFEEARMLFEIIDQDNITS